MFYLGGVVLAFFLSLLLLSKEKKTLADRVLTAWLLVMTLHQLLFYLLSQGVHPHLLALDMPLPLMHGPFLYWYTLALTGRSASAKMWPHFVAPLAIFIYLIPFFLLPVEEKLIVFKNKGAGYEVFNLVRLVCTISSGVLYVILSSLTLRKHRQSIVQQFSSTEKISLQWLQYLIYWMGAIWILVIIGNDDLIFATTVLFILFIGFFGIRQVGIFTSPAYVTPVGSETNTDTPSVAATEEKKNEGEVLSNTESERRKYQKSGLTADSSEALHQSLLLVMSTEKLFRESELSLAELAKRLNTQPNYLSQVINEREGKNFYDYINSLRIEEFMRLAADPDNRKYTLLALAQQCGFNSKSSFNRYFKKVTGKSPSEFMEANTVSEN